MISSIKAPCTTECRWSPCSTYMMTSTLTPRLRQDNGWKIWKPDGTLVKEVEVGELYHTNWRPISASRYPYKAPTNQTFEPKPEPAKPAPAVYRPPHARNKPVQAAQPEIVAVAQKFVPKSQQPKNVHPPGQLSKTSAKNKKRRQKKKQNQQQQKQEDSPETNNQDDNNDDESDDSMFTI